MEQKTVRWRRFSNASYAVFCSLHREVTIGMLSLAMVSMSFDGKSQTNGTEGIAAGDAIIADDAEVSELESVVVTSSRAPLTSSEAARMVTVLTSADIKAAAAHSVNDLLKLATGVDVRQRGEMGVQTDISVRGGTFDQITILLNGINICSPQTGHLSADFPVNMDDILRVEVLEGPAARLFGTSAFSGAINIVTDMESHSNVQAHVFGGQYGLGGGDAHVNISNQKLSQQISGGYTRCDGAVENDDFKQAKVFYQGRYNSEEANVDWMLGYSDQKYGANTFYSAAYPNQWEETERYTASVRAETKGKVRVSPTLYWNRSYDHFQLIRDTHTGENFHRNDVYGLNLNAWTRWKLGKTAVGAEVRNEGILSTNLGRPMNNDSVKAHGESDIFYKKKDNRTNISYYLEHDILLRQVTISLGLMANVNTALDEDIRLYPGIDMSYRPADDWKLTASWNQALRMPTWTDLYYKSPTQEGNTGLEPEKVNAFNVSGQFNNKSVLAQINGFYTHGTNMIDWVMYDETDIYHSANFELNTLGAEFTFGLYFRSIFGDRCPLNKFTASYAYIHQDREDDTKIFKSNYALEYLKHKAVFSLDSRIISKLNGSISYRWQDREGGYIAYGPDHKSTGVLVDYDPYGILDLRLSWDDKYYTIYAEASNLLDENYYDLGNVAQPGIWMKAGVKVKFDIFKK